MTRGCGDAFGGRRKIALWHEMRADETFEMTADVIFAMVKRSAEMLPRQSRSFYLDIEDHRNNNGGFDKDAFEIQSFLICFMAPWLTEIYMPLASVARRQAQREDLPERLVTIDSSMDVAELQKLAQRSGMDIFHGDSRSWITSDDRKSTE